MKKTKRQLEIQGVEAIGNAVQDFIGRPLGRRQLVSAAHQIRDVEIGDEGAGRLAVVARLDTGVARDPALDPIVADHSEIGAPACAPLDQVSPGPHQERPILGREMRNQIVPNRLQRRAVEGRQRSVAHHAFVIVSELQPPAGEVDIDVGQMRGIGCVAQLAPAQAQRRLAVAQGHLGALSFRDVQVGADHPLRLAPRIDAQRFERLNDPYLTVVLAADAELALADAAELQVPSELLLLFRQIFRQNGILPQVVIDQPVRRRFGAVKAKHFGVPHDVVGADVPFPHADAGRLGGEQEARLALSQGVFRPPLLVDVAHDANRAAYLASLVADRLAGDVSPNLATLGNAIKRVGLRPVLAAQGAGRRKV